MNKESRILTLNASRDMMIAYLHLKLEEHDWHGVQDAASDLRDIESELLGLQFQP